LWAAATSALLFATIALGVAYVSRAPVITPMMRFSVAPPENSTYSSIYGTAGTSGAVSPDGRHLAFVASTNSGVPMLWVRSLDALAPRMLPGTEGAGSPFWSPDSRSLAFFSNNRLLRIDVAGGPPQAVCNVQTNSGGAWGRAGVILFAEGLVIKRVAAAGGEPVAATTLDVLSNWPSFLPDGRHFLYRSLSGAIYVASLDAPEGRRLLVADTNAVYAPPGYLLFMRQDVLLAQAFDPTNFKITGEPIQIADHVASDPAAGRGAFSASETGIVTYRGGGGASVTQLTWFDRAGKPVGVLGQPGPYSNHAISPDGTRVAVERRDTAATNIWIFDRARGTPSRFTFNTVDMMPTWSPDGARIVFGSIKPGGVSDLYQKSSGGAGEEELLFKSANTKLPTDWSSDGRHLVYFDLDPKGGYDVWVLPLAGDSRKAMPFLQRPFLDAQGTMSPDGRWIAYASNESGRVEVYVQSFRRPAGSGRSPRTAAANPNGVGTGRSSSFLTLELRCRPSMCKEREPARSFGPGYRDRSSRSTSTRWL
jgi:Tol biopolymer transport system component